MGALDFLNFILALPPLAAILLVSVAVSLATTIVYKLTTNQKTMKGIKDEIKRMQAEIKSTKEPGRAAQLQKEMMKKSMEQFSASTKSMIITLVPLFLLFGWMGSHLAYEPISPGEEFTTTMRLAPGTAGNATLSAEGLQIISEPTQAIANGMAVWRLKAGEKGDYKIAYSYQNEAYYLPAIVTDKYVYANPTLAKKKGIKETSGIERITIDLKSVRPFGNLSLFGWMPGWLAAYIILSIATSMLFRKLLKVH